MGEELMIERSLHSWVVGCVTVGGLMGCLVAGKLSDIIGRKRASFAWYSSLLQLSLPRLPADQRVAGECGDARDVPGVLLLGRDLPGDRHHHGARDWGGHLSTICK